MPSVQRISPGTLKGWLQSPNPPVVVDVRDDDRIGGHVKGSIHAPSTNFLVHLPHLREQTLNKRRVVFYCQFSQQRGPACAHHYARKSADNEHNIFVLDGGFNNWAMNFGFDALTEGFASDLYV